MTNEQLALYLCSLASQLDEIASRIEGNLKRVKVERHSETYQSSTFVSEIPNPRASQPLCLDELRDFANSLYRSSNELMGQRQVMVQPRIGKITEEEIREVFRKHL